MAAVAVVFLDQVNQDLAELEVGVVRALSEEAKVLGLLDKALLR